MAKKKALVIAPGITLDCLETFEESVDREHEICMWSVGRRYELRLFLNDTDEHINMLKVIVSEER